MASDTGGISRGPVKAFWVGTTRGERVLSAEEDDETVGLTRTPLDSETSESDSSRG
jgi:hypothetical protein